MLRSYSFYLVFMLLSAFAFPQDAIYSLDFISNWTSDQHPNDYPPAAHWSTLVGATHNNNVSFWDFGQLASPGVKDVAELGDRVNITSEVNASITNGNAYQLIELPLGFGSVFSFETINVDANFPYISLMSMLAPSPDWLAEIHNVKLTDPSGNWLPSIIVNVYATDAGTDSGNTYISPDIPTIPQQPISSLENIYPFSDKILATFSFTLDQVLLSVNDIELNKSISIYPNPSRGEISIKNSGDNVLEKAEIYDVSGKLVKHFFDIGNSNKVKLNSFKSGLYFIKIYSDTGSVVKKIIIH